MPCAHQVETGLTPEGLCEHLQGEPGVILLHNGGPWASAPCSLVAARPFLTLRAFGARCELRTRERLQVHFGNPWQMLEDLMARFELDETFDLPIPLGGCFGFWGYSLKNFVEPTLSRRAHQDLDLPDAHLGFYSSLVVFDHRQERTWIVSTGLTVDGTRHPATAAQESDFWREHLVRSRSTPVEKPAPSAVELPLTRANSNFTERGFIQMVEQAQRFIQLGHIYQVNLAQRFAAPWLGSAWDLYRRLSHVSPAPFAAYVDCEDFQLASSSPELFLRCHGSEVVTRPIKGTRPRSNDSMEDAQLASELQNSAKERAELVMITDLLRNDLGRVCEYGSVRVKELFRLERYAQVQHLVSTIEGTMRPEWTHSAVLASCFPGGSITGAPKIRAMEIIEDLEPVARGPYTGVLGYLGFNRESQLSIVIRTAVCLPGQVYFHAGAGIVADSAPDAEYAETLAKAEGFFSALRGVAASNPAATSLEMGSKSGREHAAA